jgi:hypothetical protein
MFLSLLLATTIAASYPPPVCVREMSLSSPKHTFQVESWRKSDCRISGLDLSSVPFSVWVVTPDRMTAELLIPPGMLPTWPSVDISISPDERWILWNQKLYHGANAYGLFERVSGIHFREIGPHIFSEQAWLFMQHQTHHAFNTKDTLHIMKVSEWPTHGSNVLHLDLHGASKLTPVSAPNDHSLAISLEGNDLKTSLDSWFCFYDLEKHQFYLDDALRKHNKGRIAPFEKAL